MRRIGSFPIGFLAIYMTIGTTQSCGILSALSCIKVGSELRQVPLSSIAEYALQCSKQLVATQPQRLLFTRTYGWVGELSDSSSQVQNTDF